MEDSFGLFRHSTKSPSINIRLNTRSSHTKLALVAAPLVAPMMSYVFFFTAPSQPYFFDGFLFYMRLLPGTASRDNFDKMRRAIFTGADRRFPGLRDGCVIPC
jgi:hypothetical protein